MWCKSRYGFVDKSNYRLWTVIYNADAATIAGSQQSELDGENNLIKKLGLAEGPELDAAIDAVMENTVVLTGINTEW
jgi:uncharacterized protein YaaW (UPF0174 family)